MSFKNVTLLEIIEEYASINNLVEDEDHLSERFDDEVAELVINKYGEDDGPAMNEAFSDYKDYLQDDGQLHEMQVSEYSYVGKYSTE